MDRSSRLGGRQAGRQGPDLQGAAGALIATAASLDGVWDFYPGDHRPEELATLAPTAIRVPGLWEAQGHVDLDGVAWYRRRFVVDDMTGCWTLRFGAVMDIADVYLNDRFLGSHDSPFTPFEVDATAALVSGENVLAVRVFDAPLDDPEHLRLAHGKQGWASHAFPSRPSLYLTYGGIWQSVTLLRHGPVVVRDVFVNGDPDALVITADVRNASGVRVRTRVRIRTLDLDADVDVALAPGERRTLERALGATAAPRWRPDSPVLHEAVVGASVDGAESDTCTVRYGLRTIRIDGERILIDGEPYRMKSALVQGFRADELYAEGDRDAILAEVLAAKAMGFNTLRLHLKAFDPTYLDVCDEVGMLLHCDIPVGEPIDYDQLGGDTLLARRCVTALEEQVRRDRNHPSIVLWSAMNEIGDKRREIRSSRAYADFASTLARACEAADATRPVIENDWVEPDPDHVFVSRVLTAHWYGRLYAGYRAHTEWKAGSWAGVGRPFFVTEYGHWGLPEMPELPEPPFWDTREVYAANLAKTLWPGTVEAFLVETHRYQGLCDRLHTEIFRRHGHIGGYCVTQLTDVPHELNGLLDIHRRPKPIAVAEMTRANQVVLPMLELHGLVLQTRAALSAPLHVSNDGPTLADVEVEVRLGESTDAARVARLRGYAPTRLGEIAVVAPPEPGVHELVLSVAAGGRPLSENRYPIHVVAQPEPPGEVRLVGGGATADALRMLGAQAGDEGPVVVAEGALDRRVGVEVGARVGRGETVLVLAQEVDAAAHYPDAFELRPVDTMWASSLFLFTTADSPLSSLPRGAFLVAEDSTVQPTSVVAGIGARPFPTSPVVIAYKPDPRTLTGTVIGADRVAAGQLIFCQYRLAEAVVEGDAAAQALLADLLHWAREDVA